MKWKKLGRIFDPRDYSLPMDCKEFAQAPQVLSHDTFITVYFSTRARDMSGKYLSYPCYVDMEINPTIIMDDPLPNPVIPLGRLGCYDEHGIFPFNVVRHEKRILAYIGGWSRRVSVPIETSIGLAVSYDNGLTFERRGNGPILTSSPNEPFLVGDPFVAIFDGQFFMWYIFGTEWKGVGNNPPERIYKIGHARSFDGTSWHKVKDGKQIITSNLGVEECQAMPSVIRIDDLYHMFFCYRYATDFRTNGGRGYRIGHAYSSDLFSWTRTDYDAGIDISSGGDHAWDSDMICYPHVFHYKGGVYMLYNGNEFGRYGFGLAILEESL